MERVDRPGRWVGRFRRTGWGARAGAAAVLAVVLWARAAAAAYAPSADELALLALANEARAAAGLRPLVWHNGLGQAARSHSTDMATRDCFQHNSCNGQSWTTRISKYYPSWSALGEIIGLGGSDPRALHEDWMGSTPHRAKILGGYSEFGAGIALQETNFGEWAYATEDFGERGAVDLASIPTIPSGGVSPRIGFDATRELVVNYFHHGGGPPEAVRALVGSACVRLQRTAGSASNGTYGAERTFTGSGCVPVVFEAIRSDGVKQRWPAGKALLVGVGAAGLYCAETTTSVPSQDCGGGPVDPDPTPTPGPTPDGNPTDLNGVRAVLRPSRQDPSVGTVNVQATLPSLFGFDPTTAPVTVRIRAAGAVAWELIVPASCGGGPCLDANERQTTYRGRLGTASVSFARTQGDRWKLRLSGRDQTLGTLAPGPVEITVAADGGTFSASVTGDLKPGGLIAK